jgi:hypothetical protein
MDSQLGELVGFNGIGALAGFSAFLQPMPGENEKNNNSDKGIARKFFINNAS